MSTSAFWPRAASYEVFFLELAPYTAGLPPEMLSDLAVLARLIEREWEESKASAGKPNPVLVHGDEIAVVLERLAAQLEGDDREALLARAQCVRNGTADEYLAAAANGANDIMIFAGQLSTWFGKEVRRRPSAFACRRNADLSQVLAQLTADTASLAEYFSLLHKGLALQPAPAFVPSDLFFMAGEANMHPKHIAYFLPEDEGIKQSKLKKTYYFTNIHRAKLEHISWPLFRHFVQPDSAVGKARTHNVRIPAGGVLAHELGHFVLRAGTRYDTLNRLDRWASVVLQEVAADVFGTLILAEVWADRIDASAEDVVAYYLAECLQYVSRGLGLFPDSDGMLLQMNYLSTFGAIQLVEDDRDIRLQVDAQCVIAGLRSLARVLADTLLDDEPERALELYRRFGPAGTTCLDPLLNRLKQRAPRAIEYVQQYARRDVVATSNRDSTSESFSTQ